MLSTGFFFLTKICKFQESIEVFTIFCVLTKDSMCVKGGNRDLSNSQMQWITATVYKFQGVSPQGVR